MNFLNFHFLKHNKIIKLLLESIFFLHWYPRVFFLQLNFLVIIKLAKEQFNILINIKHYLKLNVIGP